MKNNATSHPIALQTGVDFVSLARFLAIEVRIMLNPIMGRAQLVQLNLDRGNACPLLATSELSDSIMESVQHLLGFVESMEHWAELEDDAPLRSAFFKSKRESAATVDGFKRLLLAEAQRQERQEDITLSVLSPPGRTAFVRWVDIVTRVLLRDGLRRTGRGDRFTLQTEQQGDLWVLDWVDHSLTVPEEGLDAFTRFAGFNRSDWYSPSIGIRMVKLLAEKAEGQFACETCVDGPGVRVQLKLPLAQTLPLERSQVAVGPAMAGIQETGS